MQIIQIARGEIAAREEQEKLYAGELFLNNVSGRTYELYVGTDGVGGKVKIGGDGVLTPTDSITELPEHPVEGALYFIEEDIFLAGNSDQEKPDYRKGDYAFWSSKLGDINGAWYRINNGGGSADETSFDNSNTNYLPGTTTVQEALVDIDRHKLGFGGVLDTSAEGLNLNSLTYADIFGLPNVKAGYYYVLNKTVKVVNGSETITFEEGDYIAVTSDVITNDAQLTAADCKFVKIPGGTHNADKINYTAGERDESAGVLYKDEDPDENAIKDSSIKTVKEGLDQLFKSKADLDHQGKVPLKQLPDTIIGAMEFQGTFVLGEDVTEFTLPTQTAKSSNDDDTSTLVKEEDLVKGDYWTYTGPRFALPAEVESSTGFINSGDNLVYNGDGKWGVIDNTSPITGIKGEVVATNGTDDTITEADNALQGTVIFKGKKRDGEDSLVETRTIVDDSTGPTLIIESPNAALIDDDNEGAVGDIYKANGNKTLIKSGLNESNNKLTITESDGVVVKGAKKDPTTYVPGVAIKQNEDTELQGEESENITVTLPAKSGTLATEEVVNDIVTGDGTDFYIPRYKKDENDKLILADSPIEITDGNVDNGYEGFVFHHGDAEDEHTAKVIFRKGDGANKEVVHSMPYVSGHILNSNSIIDCGEWKLVEGRVVVTAENEGKFDLGLPTGVNEEQYEQNIVADPEGSAVQEEIVAHIEE